MIWSEEHEGQTSGSEGARPRSGTRDGGCFGVRRHMTPKRTQICYRTCHPTDAQVDGLLVTSSSLSFIGASGDRVSSSGNFSTWQRDDGRIRDDSPPAGRDRCARIRATVHSATPMIELGRSDCVGHVANLRQARTCRGMHHESFSRIDFVAVSRTPLLAQKAVVVQPDSAMLQTPKELPRAVMEFHRIERSTAKRAIQRNGVRGCHGWEASIMFSRQPAHAEGFAPFQCIGRS